MKKKIKGLLSLALKITVPLCSALLGLELVERFNVFQLFNIVNDIDKAFDICTTVYFAIVDAIFLSLLEWIKRNFFQDQTIQATLSKPNELVENKSFSDLLLQNDNPCEAVLTVTTTNVKKKTCKGLNLIIEGINFATMQLPSMSAEARVDENGNFVLELDKIFGNQEESNTTQTFRILFTKEPANGKCQSELRPKLTKEPWTLAFSPNKLIVRTE